MAVPTLVTVRDFTTSRYAQLAENTEGQLTDILARAETAIQTRLQRPLAVTSYTEVFRAKTQVFFTKRRPIVSVTSLKRRANAYFAWETMNLSRLTVESGPGYVESIDPIALYEIEVVYTAGYATLPEDLKEAIIMQAVLFSTQDLEVYGSGDSRAPGYIVPMNADIDRLIAPYKATATVYH
jgi:hypothetical protein